MSDNETIPELPVEGFPVSADLVREWFEHRHGRTPGERELGRMMIAMAAREASPPVQDTAAGEPGWALGPNAHPRSGA
jgi:hypothetical protein